MRNDSYTPSRRADLRNCSFVKITKHILGEVTLLVIVIESKEFVRKVYLLRKCFILFHLKVPGQRSTLVTSLSASHTKYHAHPREFLAKCEPVRPEQGLST